MNINKKLDALGKIRPVEAPPFLLTRIEARINAGYKNIVSPGWRLSAIAAFVILLVANIYVASKAIMPGHSNNIETVVAGMALSSSNDLYE